MKTILHPDYWVEIPAGEFLIGVSEAQRNLISAHIRRQMGYEQFSRTEQELIESIITKLRRYRDQPETDQRSLYEALGFTPEEYNIYKTQPFTTLIVLEDDLMSLRPQEAVWLECFYIARFPITQVQYGEFEKGTPISHLSSPLFGSDFERVAAIVQDREAKQLCQQLGGRLPSDREWEKAARGTDGRLYPWGNEWDWEAGHFYRGQTRKARGVDAFPKGVSPYGVWAMVGGLPELTEAPGMGFTLSPYTTTSIRGRHPKESSETWAWFHHMIPMPGEGGWVGMRPVLDQWPAQQWQGHREEAPPPPEPEPLMNQFEWLALKLEMGPELEPVIVPIEAEQKEEAERLLKTLLRKNARSVPAWLLLTAVLSEASQQRDCIERALQLKPTHWLARKMQARVANMEVPPPTESP